MKKILALFLALIMATCLLTACGGNGTTDTSSVGSDNDNENPPTGEKLTLVMATNAAFKPYEYVDENGKFAGIDIEIGEAIAAKMGMNLQVEDMDFDSIITAVQSGKAQIGMAGMTVTEDRQEEVNFTNTYATGKQVIIVKDGGAVASPDDLEGKKIGVQRGTTGDIYSSDDYGTNEDGTENGNVVRYNTGNEAVMALSAGVVDAVVIDNEPAKSLVAANEGKGLKILETEYVYEEYAICVSKDNAELLGELNKAIDALVKDGTIDKIIEKYIPAQQ